MATFKLYAWLCYNGNDLVDHHFIKLHDDHTITWGQNTTRTGQWVYYYDSLSDNSRPSGYMTLEFRANPFGNSMKKHFMDQLNDSTFELREKDDTVYDEVSIWSSNSTLHCNTCRIIMKHVDVINDETI